MRIPNIVHGFEMGDVVRPVGSLLQWLVVDLDHKSITISHGGQEKTVSPGVVALISKAPR